MTRFEFIVMGRANAKNYADVVNWLETKLREENASQATQIQEIRLVEIP